MAIKGFQVSQVSLSGVTPNWIYINTNDPIATVTAAGYLNELVKSVGGIPQTSLAVVTTQESSTSALVTNIYGLLKSGNDWVLVGSAAPGQVILPTTANHLAIFNNTIGQLSQDTANAITTGNLTVLGGTITAGEDGTQGTLISYPATPSSGSLSLQCADNAGDFDVTINNASHGQDTVYRIPDVGSATGSFLISDLVPADASPNLVYFSASITAAGLNAGNITLIPASVSKSYRITYMFMNLASVAFDVGGDRDIQITDGTTVYSVITDTTMQVGANMSWGQSTGGFPFPASAALSTPTTAGAALVASYSGGTTDFTNGTAQLVIIAQRVA